MQVVWENNAAGIYRNYKRIKEIKHYVPHGRLGDAIPPTVEDNLVAFGTKVKNLCSDKQYLTTALFSCLTITLFYIVKKN